MGEGGLEPPRPYEHWHLKPARLPFRHSPEWMLHASNTFATTHPCRGIYLRIIGSGIVLVMSATDWETRELESASRERLLVEIGTLQQALASTDQRTGVGELQQQISELKQQVSELQQGLIAARDFAMGAASRAGEAQAQVIAQAGQLGAAQARVAFLSKHINRMRNSTTWKLGRIMMLPVRIIKKITGKTA